MSNPQIDEVSRYLEKMEKNRTQPQASNFKKKAEMSIQFYLSGSDNSDYRSIIKKIMEATGDY